MRALPFLNNGPDLTNKFYLLFFLYSRLNLDTLFHELDGARRRRDGRQQQGANEDRRAGGRKRSAKARAFTAQWPGPIVMQIPLA